MQQRSDTINNLFDFTVTTYGIGLLLALLAGLFRFEDWETLASAVFGVSASALEAAWHAAAG